MKMQYFDVETKTWKPLLSIAQLTDPTTCVCAEYDGNCLYVAARKGNGLNGFSNVNYRYHPINNSWETLPPFLSGTFGNSQIDSLCSVGNYLYAISSGSACVPYRYSPGKNNWQRGPKCCVLKYVTLDDQLSNATVAVWKSNIYVLHGLKRKTESCNLTSSGFVLGSATQLEQSSTFASAQGKQAEIVAPTSSGIGFGSAQSVQGKQAEIVAPTSSGIGFGSAQSVQGKQAKIVAPTSSGFRFGPAPLAQGNKAEIIAPPSNGFMFGSAPSAQGKQAKMVAPISSGMSFGSAQLAKGKKAEIAPPPSSGFGFSESTPLAQGIKAESVAPQSSGLGLISQSRVDKPSVVHCFDLKKNEWKPMASTCHPHFNSSLFVVNDRHYVAMGGDNSQCGSSPALVEVYDEENNTWSVVEQKHIPPNNLGAVEIEGRVYFVINRFPVDFGVRVPPGEVYNICLNEWENLAEIDSDAVLCYMPVAHSSLKTE